MALLAGFPNELIDDITKHLHDSRHLAALARTCRRTFPVANRELYRRVPHNHPLFWASDVGRPGTVRKALAAGADPNKSWDSYEGHPLTQKAWPPTSSRERTLQSFYAKVLVRGRREGEFPTVYYTTHGRGVGGWVGNRSSSKAKNGGLKPAADGRDVEMFENQPGGAEMDWCATEPQPLKPWNWMEDDPVLPSLDLDKRQAIPDEPGSATRNVKSPVWYPLHLAAMGGHTEIAELLVDSGADLDSVARRVCSCKRAKLNCADRHVSRTLGWIQDEGDKLLLEQDMLVTPVHVALCHQQEDVALMLLRRGAARTFDRPGWQEHILHTAAAFGCIRVVEFLLAGDGAADIDVQNSRGMTPLYYAYSTRQQEMTLWLLDNNANVNVQLGTGLTLLHLACLDGAFALANRLVEYGADINRPWEQSICPNLPALRPLEVCCLLPPTKSRRVYALGDALLHEHRFERRRLRLMARLLDAGASTAPTPAVNYFWDDIPNQNVSAVSFAASQHSIPMLELLAASGADMTQEASAIHAAVYPPFMEWTETPGPNPLATLRWLVAHGVPVDGESVLAIDALAIVCALPADYPWKTDVVEWFTDRRVRSDTRLSIDWIHSSRIHPLHFRNSPNNAKRFRETSPFWEALRQMDFPTCKILARSLPCPSPVKTLSHLVRDPFPRLWGDWPDEFELEASRHDESGEKLRFLLEIDEQKTIEQDHDTFRTLVRTISLHHASRLLIDSYLPTDLPTSGRSEKSKIVQLILGMRDRDSTHTQSYWDLAYRLAEAISFQNYNAAHFILQHCEDTTWAQEKGMEYFLPIISALRLAPPPSAIGRTVYQTLLWRWERRVDRDDTDVHDALFKEACEGPIDLAPFLKNRNIDVNSTDSQGNTALHRLFTYVEKEGRSIFGQFQYDTPRQLLDLLRAGADPMAVNENEDCVLDYFWSMYYKGVDTLGPLSLEGYGAGEGYTTDENQDDLSISRG